MQVHQVFKDLKTQKKKLTLVRKAIIRLFSDSHVLLTASELQQELAEQGIKVNKTTVYRELDFLLHYQIIKEIAIKSGITHYESFFHPHHHHLTCSDCGGIESVDTPELENSLRELENRLNQHGFAVQEHSLEFFGLCAGCR
jgi:Fe2+ or Zn2+ uptake regulation protein